jgi:hypothetical protein
MVTQAACDRHVCASSYEMSFVQADKWEQGCRKFKLVTAQVHKLGINAVQVDASNSVNKMQTSYRGIQQFSQGQSLLFMAIIWITWHLRFS